MNLVVAEGDAPQQLRSGPGHRIGTPLPARTREQRHRRTPDGWGGSLSIARGAESGRITIAVQTESTGGPIGVFDVVSVTRVERET